MQENVKRIGKKHQHCGNFYQHPLEQTLAAGFRAVMFGIPLVILSLQCKGLSRGLLDLERAGNNQGDRRSPNRAANSRSRDASAK